MGVTNQVVWQMIKMEKQQQVNDRSQMNVSKLAEPAMSKKISDKLYRGTRRMGEVVNVRTGGRNVGLPVGQTSVAPS